VSDVRSHSGSERLHLRRFEAVLEREDRPVAAASPAERVKLREMLREA
jgi:hypothetical protein